MPLSTTCLPILLSMDCLLNKSGLTGCYACLAVLNLLEMWHLARDALFLLYRISPGQ